ncbi:26S protease regulatory subunit 4-like protein 1 [Pleurostoma richardsiae]|uniref:26S protease regulatory subunit 4-like protein 1 n=1 Tax=Pleurostoma richardsiae TaxID=41990 RepID=A0AA38VIC5_9PEZI|nr:26S protease regulatory subunit 4-like protein 1 [Pleurostoma richardsiae]
MATDSVETAASHSDDDSYSVIERLADAIRIEDEQQTAPEDRSRLVQDLYEGPRKCQCCINWVEEVPTNLELSMPAMAVDDADGPAIVIRRRVMRGQRKKQLNMHSVEIRNAEVRRVLLEVFAGLDNLLPQVRYLIFLAPFRQFFWRWDRFEKAVQDERDEAVRTILLQLRAVIRAELAQAFAVTKELVTHGIITQDFLWTIFPPGELIYSVADDADRFYILQTPRLRGCGYPSNDLYLKYVDWDGSKFGYWTTTIRFDDFLGTKKITDLKAFPARYLHDLDEIKAGCLERAQKFQSLAGIHYKGYRSLEKSSRDAEGTGRLDRRIILDAEGHPSRRSTSVLYDRPEEMKFRTGLITQAPVDKTPPGGHRPLPQPTFTVNGPVANYDGMPGFPMGRPMPPREDSIYSSDESSGARRRRLRNKKKKADHPRVVTRKRSDDSLSSIASDDSDSSVTKELSEFHLLLCNSRLLGFCLREKEWRSFDVERIQDIEWNAEPFDSLVLPEGYKELILSFVESQLKDGDTFDDVINGKGGGLVILLAGDPGVGKTLTAESVAEKMHTPLYKMELSELAEDEEDSGTEKDDDDISSTFDLAARWNAVLLIDECDMYLEKRSEASPKRNKIVSRFLQELEYYPSLLFLTTNREKVLDPAIYSRIHLTINYPALDVPSRQAIWHNFLEREPGSAVSNAEVKVLAAVEVNGRRIRNIIKTARIMAKRERRGICFDDIRRVMKITEGLAI